MGKRPQRAGGGARPPEVRWCKGHAREHPATEFPRQPAAVRGRGPFCRDLLDVILFVPGVPAPDDALRRAVAEVQAEADEAKAPERPADP